MQVLHADLVERTYHAALQKAPVAVNGAGVDIAANPFLCGVVHYFVLLDVGWHPFVEAGIVGVERARINRDVVLQLVNDVVAVHCGEVEGLGAAIALDHAEHRLFLPWTALAALVVFLGSHVRFRLLRPCR